VEYSEDNLAGIKQFAATMLNVRFSCLWLLKFISFVRCCFAVRILALVSHRLYIVVQVVGFELLSFVSVNV